MVRARDSVASERIDGEGVLRRAGVQRAEPSVLVEHVQREAGLQRRAGREVTLARVIRRVGSEPSPMTPASIVVRTRTARVEVRPGADAAALAVVLAALGAVRSAP